MDHYAIIWLPPGQFGTEIMDAVGVDQLPDDDGIKGYSMGWRTLPANYRSIRRGILSRTRRNRDGAHKDANSAHRDPFGNLGHRSPGRDHSRHTCECVPLAEPAKADFAGTSRSDVVLGLPRQPGPPGVYRSIIVRSPDGATLLDLRSPVMFWSVFVVGVAGAPRPLLITGTPDGNRLRIEAWMHASPQAGF